MLLSILIPTLPEPDNIRYLERLRALIDPQVARYPNQVELFINDAPRSMTTGQKRNELIKHSVGEYFSFIDDDDLVSADYVDRIMRVILSPEPPDVITFNGFMTTDGVSRRNFVIRLGEKYEERAGVYYRYPNHLCIMKRSVVEKILFPPQWVQEDYMWATEIRDRGLLKTSIHIDADLYHYDFRSKKQSKPNTGNEIVSRATQVTGSRNRNIRKRFLR